MERDPMDVDEEGERHWKQGHATLLNIKRTARMVLFQGGGECNTPILDLECIGLICKYCKCVMYDSYCGDQGQDPTSECSSYKCDYFIFCGHVLVIHGNNVKTMYIFTMQK